MLRAVSALSTFRLAPRPAKLSEDSEDSEGVRLCDCLHCLLIYLALLFGMINSYLLLWHVFLLEAGEKRGWYVEA